MPPKRPLPQKRACDACYKRKIQCSHPNADGPCEWCDHRGLECTFERGKPQKKRRSSDVQNLFHRVKQLEDALAQAEPALDSRQDVASSETSATAGPSTVSTHRQLIATSGSPLGSTVLIQEPDSASEEARPGLSSSASQWGPNWFFNGISMSSERGRRWISTRTDQRVTWADFSIPITKISPSLASPLSSSPKILELPNEDTTAKVMSMFFRSRFRLSFPVLDEILFEDTLKSAYDSFNPSLPSTTQISARACVLSALSFACCIDPSSQILIDAKLCATKAHNLFLQIADNISLFTLQIALILQIQHTFYAEWQHVSFFHSISCRIVCALRGHLYPPPTSISPESSHAERERQHVRMLFWLCYMLDKDLSLCTGNPPLLTDIYCDLDLPDNYFDHYTYLLDLDGSFAHDDRKAHENFVPHFPEDPRLSHLKEKVFRQLLSARALKDSDNQLLLNIRQIDDEIEHWRLSIPNTFRPTLSASNDSLSKASDGGIACLIYRMSLQLDYQYLMTIVHTTVRKCSIAANDDMPDLHSVAHSSFDLSLMASRSTLSCLRALLGAIGADAFRFVTFYSSTAALSLFLDILIHPRGPQARLDLELLISAANMIRNMPEQALTEEQITCVQEISNFVMRLVWLGTCAVAKAEKQERS